MPVTRFLLILLVLLNLLALAAARGWLGESAQRGEPERLTNQINPQAISLRQALTPLAQTRVAEPEIATMQRESGPTEAVVTDTEPTPPPSAPAQTSPAIADATPSADPEPERVVIESPPVPPEPNPPAAREMACIVYDGLGEQQAATLGRSAAAVRPDVQINRRMTETASNWWVHIPAPANRIVAEDRAATLRASGISDLFIVRDEGPHKNAISLGMFRTESSAKQHLSDLRARRVTDARIIARKPAVFGLELRAMRPDINEISARLRGNPYGVSARECVP